MKYHLETMEIEESLLCLDYKKEGRWKYVNIFGLEFIIILCLVLYIRRREEILFLLLAGSALLLLFFMLYVPGLKRKKKAREMAAGKYQITFPVRQIVKGFESERVFTIMTGQETYCIPKRVLNDMQMRELRSAAKSAGTMLYVKTGG